MMLKRQFYDRDKATGFVKMKKKERKVATISKVKWLKKTADGWDEKYRYEVYYEK